jgi:hypothetical protein
MKRNFEGPEEFLQMNSGLFKWYTVCVCVQGDSMTYNTGKLNLLLL